MERRKEGWKEGWVGGKEEGRGWRRVGEGWEKGGKGDEEEEKQEWRFGEGVLYIYKQSGVEIAISENIKLGRIKVRCEIW